MKLSTTRRSLIDHKSRTTTIGWREWVSLPQLNIPALKVKADTGARTSSLHAINIEPFEENGELQVRFSVPPVQQRDDYLLACTAPVVDQRTVRDSGGHSELRYVVETQLRIGKYRRVIDLTLTHRKGMRFRMLLGRSALAPNLIVDSSTSYRQGRLRLAQCYPDLASIDKKSR